MGFSFPHFLLLSGAPTERARGGIAFRYAQRSFQSRIQHWFSLKVFTRTVRLCYAASFVQSFVEFRSARSFRVRGAKNSSPSLHCKRSASASLTHRLLPQIPEFRNSPQEPEREKTDVFPYPRFPQLLCSSQFHAPKRELSPISNFFCFFGQGTGLTHFLPPEA